MDSLTKNKFLKNGSSEQVFWFCWLILMIIFLIVHISFQVVPAIFNLELTMEPPNATIFFFIIWTILYDDEMKVYIHI